MTKSEFTVAGDLEAGGLHLRSFAHGAENPVCANSILPEGETQLIRLAAAETVAVAGGKPVVVPKTAGSLTPDEMLGAVAYCYIKGVFSSADVEGTMLRDPEFREALDGVVPDPATIRRFRRLNREAIQTALERFYAYLRRQQKIVRGTLPGAVPANPAGGPPGAAQAPSRPEENTAVFVRREAVECLDKATFIDGMSDF